jgi:ABC-2 type transport system ATP-binding protein
MQRAILQAHQCHINFFNPECSEGLTLQIDLLLLGRTFLNSRSTRKSETDPTHYLNLRGFGKAANLRYAIRLAVMLEPILQVDNLVKHYGDVHAVRGVSFSVAEGEVFGLLGPNGAGKTTTVEILEGLRNPDGGFVRVCGFDPQVSSRELKHEIGASLQSTSLPDKLRVMEALRLFAGFYKRRRDPEELLKRFGLEEKRNTYYSKLSGGQKQRLALAMALVNDPRVLFFDEPTAGLDPQVRREIYDIIEELRREKKTILMTTHYIEEAERLCDRVAIVDHGKVIACGSPRELKQRSGGNTRIEVKLAKPAANGTLRSLEGVVDAREVGGTYVLHTQRPPQAIVSLVKHLEAEGNELVSLEIATPSLEDVFIEMTGRRLRD